ncbi:EamA family transporter [Nakamurella sp. YIM 132087]|uniref:EamA family transporter n=1 Tax=Nakamurella alba TaxID=2665158 RepID=A0A7K1FH50_9ACTN|nr:EamA family transporter [Nakamurella alba]MTD13457.1 EamA family transporter [Nakamurella alba]
MDRGTVAIILVAAIAHAAWNLASKYKRGDTFLFVWAYTGASALLCLPLGILLSSDVSHILSWHLVGASVASGVLHLAYSLTLQAGYDRAELGVVYPVARGTGPMLTMLTAVLLLHERPGWLAVVGALAVVAGILVVTGNPARNKGMGGRASRGVIWGAATGLTIAAYTVWDAFAIKDLGLAPESYYAGTLLVQCVLLAPGAVRRRRLLPDTLRKDRIPIVVVAVLSPLAYILVLIAMRTAPVALVAPLRESSIVVGSLVAWRLFRERDPARRVVGAVVVLAGIVAISV